MKGKMKTQDIKTKPRLRKFGIRMSGIAVLLITGLLTVNTRAQAPHQNPAVPADAATLQTQIGQLRNQVAELARIIQSHGGGATMPAAQGGAMPGMPGMSPGAPAGSGMSIGDMGMKRMGMDNMMMGMSGMKSGGGMPGMNSSGGKMGMDSMMMGMMKGMDMMGMMDGMPGMNMSSALPGFPGASHLYHIGATGFFLDHPEHITLTTEQQMSLNKIKEQAVLAKNSSDREMADAEQELWQLTSSDQPDAVKIEGKVREIEKKRADARLAFIRSVGEAAKVLTDEQRKVLVGQMPASGQAGAAHQHKP